jgi:hypothetical protein
MVAKGLRYRALSANYVVHEHEAYCAARQRNATLAGESIPDLIAIGPDIVFVGEFFSPDNAEWSFHLRNFVDGHIHTLIAFIERYEQTGAMDRHVLVAANGPWCLAWMHCRSRLRRACRT